MPVTQFLANPKRYLACPSCITSDYQPLGGGALLARDQLARSLARARIGMRPLAAHRQVRGDGACRDNIPRSISRLIDCCTSRRRSPSTLTVLVDHLADPHLLVGGEIVAFAASGHLGLLQNLVRRASGRYRRYRSARFPSACFLAIRLRLHVPSNDPPPVIPGAACGVDSNTKSAPRLRGALPCSSCKSF